MTTIIKIMTTVREFMTQLAAVMVSSIVVINFLYGVMNSYVALITSSMVGMTFPGGITGSPKGIISSLTAMVTSSA